jgi:transposase
MSGTVHPIEWQESAKELYTRYRSAADVPERTRLQDLWLVRSGETEQEAARMAGVGRRTLARWLGWYRTGGLTEVLHRVPGHGSRGAPSRLTAEQREALLARCAAGAFHTYGEAQQWVEQEFGVHYRYHGIYDLLSRMTVHPKVPRPTAAKADPAARAAWKKNSDGRRGVRVARRVGTSEPPDQRGKLNDGDGTGAS